MPDRGVCFIYFLRIPTEFCQHAHNPVRQSDTDPKQRQNHNKALAVHQRQPTTQWLRINKNEFRKREKTKPHPPHPPHYTREI